MVDLPRRKDIKMMDNEVVLEQCRQNSDFAVEYIKSLQKENEELKEKNEKLRKRIKMIGVLIDIHDAVSRRSYRREEKSLLDKVEDFLF